MYGTSYSGFNAIQVAMRRPPALKAIVPIYATDDRYTDDVHYMGGSLRLLDVVDYPTYMIAMNALPPVPSIVGAGLARALAATGSTAPSPGCCAGSRSSRRRPVLAARLAADRRPDPDGAHRLRRIACPR